MKMYENGKKMLIGSDNGLLPVRCLVITRCNAVLWSIEPLRAYTPVNINQDINMLLRKAFENMAYKFMTIYGGLDVPI